MKNKNTRKFFLIMILVFIISRSILITGPLQYIDDDRAVEGLMSKHMLKGAPLPVFVYGIHYAGGATVSVYISALFIYLFGLSASTFKFYSLLVATAFLSLLFCFLRKKFDDKAAIFGSLLVLFSMESFTRLSLKIPGYMFMMMSHIIIVSLFLTIFFEKKKKPFNSFDYVILGMLTVLCFWISESVVPIIVSMIVFWYISDKLFILRKNFWIYISSSTLSFVPLLVYNLNNKFANIKHLFVESPVHWLVCKYDLFPDLVYCIDPIHKGTNNIVSFFTSDLPNHFSGQWAYYIIFLLSFAVAIYLYRDDLWKLTKGLIPKRSFSVELKNIKKEAFIISYSLFFLFTYYSRGMGKTSYFLLGYTFMIITISIVIRDLIINKSHKVKLAGYSMLAIVIISGFTSTASIEAHPELKLYPEVTKRLMSDNISYAYADFSIKWPIIFYSDEEVIASCEGMCHCLGEGRKPKYPPYESAVNSSERFAYILRKGSRFQEDLSGFLENNSMPHKEESVGNMMIYILDEGPRPRQVVSDCYSNRYFMLPKEKSR